METVLLKSKNLVRYGSEDNFGLLK